MRKKQIYLYPGRLLKFNQTEFHAAIMRGLQRIELVTDTVFAPQLKPRGARFAPATAKRMVELYPKGGGKVPLALQVKNTVYFLSDVDRFKTVNAIEAVTIHEYGHVLRIPHSTDPTSIMNVNFTSMSMNNDDIKAFQRKLGKPRKK